MRNPKKEQIKGKNSIQKLLLSKDVTDLEVKKLQEELTIKMGELFKINSEIAQEVKKMLGGEETHQPIVDTATIDATTIEDTITHEPKKRGRKKKAGNGDKKNDEVDETNKITLGKQNNQNNQSTDIKSNVLKVDNFESILNETKQVGKEDKKVASKEPLPGSRGKLKNDIIEILSKSKKPVKIEEIAKKLNKSEANIYVWFASTGKTIPGITKVSPGTYTFELEGAKKTKQKEVSIEKEIDKLLLESEKINEAELDLDNEMDEDEALDRNVEETERKDNNE
jgi:hypothetical protein